VEVGRHLNIELKTLCEVNKISGSAGDFDVELSVHPRYVDMDKCIACGACTEKCPKKVTDNFNAGLAKRKAVYVDYPQAVPLKYAIDPENCIYLVKNGRCGVCQKVCPTDAIDFDQTDETINIKVGSVVMAPGFSTFDPSGLDNYQYSQYSNVITSLEMERILSATGPFNGHLVRPSDNKEPKKVAWLQCVGSRDNNKCDNSYCSSVCCMYAIKEAVIAKEHSGDELDTAIFYMDMRTYGKEFEGYYERAKNEQKVRFIRSRIHTIEEDRETNDLILKYVDDHGKILTEIFDMVVLSVGMQTPKEVVALADRLDIKLNDNNFVDTDSFNPVSTSREGIFVCGSFQEPKDIPMAVMEASAAACDAQTILSDARNSLTKEKTFPEERDVSDKEPRIGVFVCNCGTNIGGIVDVPSVAEMAKTLPDVVYVEENLFTCSQDTQEKLKEVIEENDLNRIVVAACTPRTHEALFQETLKEAGLNKYLFEMANIRNQCSWVHSKEKDEATKKAKILVQMAIARARRIKPLKQPTISIDSNALVIGGGVAGMAAALGLADQGFHTSIVEKSNQLGGVALNLESTWRGEDIGQNLETMIRQVNNNSLIDVYTESVIKNATGFLGNFETTLITQTTQSEKEINIKHGAVIVTVGATEYEPDEYLHGKDERVLTHLDFDMALKTNDKIIKGANSAVFIQCVGSREPDRPYCSKVCCTHSIKSAIRLKDIDPEKDVYILYRDIRTYGQRESLYKEARDKGVIFIRYDVENKPKVEKSGKGLTITIKDHVLNRNLEIDADLIVLASAIVPLDNQDLAKMFKLSLTQDNFFNEAHAKLRPVEFATEGIFLAGMAHYPKPIEESIAQAKAAASRAAVALSKDSLTVEGIVSFIETSMCRGCGECEKHVRLMQ
ncbi:MAG: CoB--CoM heterodisulfide reductase iron-sulfur subunit A family protein, partial [Desulfobacteraceae bacterium]|nr:CoB--CoM heterodisulfide reductase iron-sulfur subunit A family protein [Desulfobacteraceae bacterium]